MPPHDSGRVPPGRSEYNRDFAERFMRSYANRLRWATRTAGRMSDSSNWRTRMPDYSPSDDQPRDEGVDVIRSVDFEKRSNGREHQTGEYECVELVVRRGWQFSVRLNLNRPLSQDESIQLKLWANIDDEPSYGPADTKVLLKEENRSADAKREWRFFVEEKTDGHVTLKVTSPQVCIVGRWSFQANVVKNSGEEVESFTAKKQIFVIFNAYHKSDGCYLADSDEREEYIQNEEGSIFVGSARWARGRDWDFAQFESPVLEAAIKLLDSSQLKPAARRSPVTVTRAISALVNSSDDNGVIIGNWSRDYSGGTAPTAWTGSVKILEQFWKTGKPVAYGQCWVFSAVTTSLCRALGIACRSVTNFDSAHDTDANMSKDVCFDANMERMDHDDSIWNFHVWNEVWMRRPDLPPGYDGWQAIDATPQETSEGVYQLGPAPLAACREGNVHLPYDLRFLFGEVNSDIVHWQYKQGEGWRVIKVKDSETGTKVLTKSVGSSYANNITHLYKPEEGTPEERMQVKLAVLYGENPHLYRDVSEPLANDVRVSVDGNNSVALIANDFTYAFHYLNTSDAPRTLTSKVVVKKTQYTGVAVEVLYREVYKKTLEPQEGEKHEVIVPLGRSLLYSNDDCSLKVQTVTVVEETQQVVSGDIIVPVDLPTVEVTPSNYYPRVGSDVLVDLQVPNPFDTPLTMAHFEISGAGLEKPRKVEIGVVKAKGVAATQEIIVPKRAGNRTIHVTFSCKQFQGGRGTASLTVQP